MDILCGDAGGMQETLSRLGYTWSSTNAVEAHHSPRASRDDLDLSIDTYNYIPVWSYPQEPIDAEFDPKLNPGVWNQTVRPVHTEIHLADVLEHSMSDLGSEAEPLIVPDATMSVLIVCAHLFTDFFHGMPGRFGRLPLARFAEICELCRHPAFDQATFVDLVRQFSVSDSVHFVGGLLASYMGYNPLASTVHSGETRREWSRFYRSTFWLPALGSYDDLLMPREAAEPLGNLVDELGANLVFATDHPGEHTYWSGASGEGEPLGRVITRNEGTERLELGVSLGWGTDAMVVEIEVVGIPESEDNVYMEFGGFPSFWGVSRDGLVGEGWRELGGYSSVDHAFTDTGYTLRVVIPWALRKDLPRHDRTIPLLLSAIRVSRGRTGRPTVGMSESATLVPMNVMRR
jgi:hypothetical protein